MSVKTNFTLIISQIIEYLGVSRNDFAKTLGYSRSQSIYDIASGKSRPSFDFFERFFKSEFRNIFNPIWMFTGEGEMLKQAYLTEEDVIYNVTEGEEFYSQTLPYVSKEDRGFFVKNIMNESFFKVLPTFEIPGLKGGNTVVFEDPKESASCASQSYLLAQEYDVSTIFTISDIYILSTVNELLFIQVVKFNEEKDYYEGKNQEDKDICIPRKDIVKAWRTIMIMSSVKPL